jgi:hypothetical protein
MTASSGPPIESRFLTPSTLKRPETEENPVNLRDFTRQPPTHGMGIADVIASVGSMELTILL